MQFSLRNLLLVIAGCSVAAWLVASLDGEYAGVGVVMWLVVGAFFSVFTLSALATISMLAIAIHLLDMLLANRRKNAAKS